MIQPPNPEKSPGTSFLLEEPDGHLTQYTYGPSNMYWADNGSKNGRCWFEFANGRWHRYDPATGASEYYDHPSGLLKESRDKENRGFIYEYDSQNQLIAIKSTESFTCYDIKRSDKLISIVVNSASGPLILQQYKFDEFNRLVATYIPNNGEHAYVIRYTYNLAGYLQEVTQSDGTAVNLSYLAEKVDKVQFGLNSQPEAKSPSKPQTILPDPLQLVRFQYDQNKVKISNDAYISYITVEQSQIKKVSRYPGCTIKDTMDDKEVKEEETLYSYNTYQQLTTIIHPDKSPETFTYTSDPRSLLENHILPNCQLTTEVYTSNGRLTQHDGTIRTILPTARNPDFSKNILDQKNDKASLTPTEPIKLNTTYVYDFNWQKPVRDFEHKNNTTSNPNKVITAVKLSFIISPAGKVIQLKRNTHGDIEFIRAFLKDAKLGVSPKSPPDNDSMSKWASDKLQNTSLVQLIRDSKGRINIIKRFAEVDADGNGIESSASFDEQTPDVYDNIVKLDTLYDPTKPLARSGQEFDRLKRLLGLTDPFKNTTSHQYLDDQSKIITTYPNQQQEIKIFNNKGQLRTYQQIDSTGGDPKLQPICRDNKNILPSSEIKSSNNKQVKAETIRETTCVSNAGGFPVLRKLPDGRYEYSLYDLQQRLAIEISHTGLTKRIWQDAIHRYQETIRYSQPVKTTSFFKPEQPDSYPLNDKVISTLKEIRNDSKARIKYEFKDASQRLHYEVDEENYLTEHLYDTADRQIGIIRYKNPINTQQLAQLKNGENLSLTFNLQEDRYHQTLYDLDGNITMELDPEGYITQYNRDAAGRIIEKIIYQNKIAVVINGKPNPTPDTNDAHSYYYYDGGNQCIGEVDAEGYYTAHTHYPNGLRKTSTSYYNELTNAHWPADEKNIPQKYCRPQVPKLDLEDQVTEYTYDALGRLIQIDGPSGKSTVTSYDNRGQITATQIKDNFNPDKTDSDYQRGTQTRYNVFGQVIAQANSFVNNLLIQKDADQEKIWQTQSLRIHI